MPHSLKKRLKHFLFGDEGEIYHLEDVVDKGSHKEAWMKGKEFDEVTEDLIVVEIDGQRMSFLSTPVIPFVIFRRDDKQK